MSFGKLKRALKGIINRKDLTDELAGDFINRAIDEVERVARLGAMEQLVEAEDWDGTRNSLAIPTGYLETIDLFTDAGVLRMVTKDQFFAHPDQGAPAVYIKAGASFLVKPYPAKGETVRLHYYGESLPLLADDGERTRLSPPPRAPSSSLSPLAVLADLVSPRDVSALSLASLSARSLFLS